MLSFLLWSGAVSASMLSTSITGVVNNPVEDHLIIRLPKNNLHTHFIDLKILLSNKRSFECALQLSEPVAGN